MTLIRKMERWIFFVCLLFKAYKAYRAYKAFKPLSRVSGVFLGPTGPGKVMVLVLGPLFLGLRMSASSGAYS